jgi:hypothetical protein
MKQENINNENIKIQALLESYLRFRSAAAKTQTAAGSHLDEDSLAAFVDGDLTARENNSFLAHLVECSFCLHKTAELSQLRAAFEEEAYEPISETSQTTKVSEVLSNLFSRLFGSTEGVVFAHEEKPEEPKDNENGTSPEESSTDKDESR